MDEEQIELLKKPWNYMLLLFNNVEKIIMMYGK